MNALVFICVVTISILTPWADGNQGRSVSSCFSLENNTALGFSCIQHQFKLGKVGLEHLAKPAAAASWFRINRRKWMDRWIITCSFHDCTWMKVMPTTLSRSDSDKKTESLMWYCLTDSEDSSIRVSAVDTDKTCWCHSQCSLHLNHAKFVFLCFS